VIGVDTLWLDDRRRPEFQSLITGRDEESVRWEIRVLNVRRIRISRLNGHFGKPVQNNQNSAIL
jgi:hypothetical protein